MGLPFVPSIRRLRSLGELLASPADVWLTARTVAWIATLPLLKRVVPFKRLVRLMWLNGNGRARQRAREQHVVTLVRRITRQSGGNCLERSLILYRFLSRINTDPQLVVGMGGTTSSSATSGCSSTELRSSSGRI